MKLFRIYDRTGADYGVWEGETPQDAWEAMVRDAGGPATDVDGNPIEGRLEDWEIMESTNQEDQDNV